MIDSESKTKALDVAIPMIAEFEGCRLRAYQDAVGVWTIGYGSTRGIKSRDVWTQQEADDALKREVAEFMDHVLRYVQTDVNAHQLAALTSLAYNIGVNALHKSTLLRLLNRGDYWGAANQFGVWNRAGRQVLNGLVLRRAAERDLFCGFPARWE